MLQSMPLYIRSVRICAWFDRFFNFHVATFSGNNGLTQSRNKGRDNTDLGEKKSKPKTKLTYIPLQGREGFTVFNISLEFFLKMFMRSCICSTVCFPSAEKSIELMRSSQKFSTEDVSI